MATTPTYPIGTVALDRFGTAWQKGRDGMWRSANHLETKEGHIRRDFEQVLYTPESVKDETLRRWLETHLKSHRYSVLSTAELANDIMLLIEEAEDAG